MHPQKGYTAHIKAGVRTSDYLIHGSTHYLAAAAAWPARHRGNQQTCYPHALSATTTTTTPTTLSNLSCNSPTTALGFASSANSGSS